VLRGTPWNGVEHRGTLSVLVSLGKYRELRSKNLQDFLPQCTKGGMEATLGIIPDFFIVN
jgi:hypothetical protein